MPHEIDTATQLCAVIGNPVEHSLSPRMHNAAFQSLGLNYVYLAFRVVDVGHCLAGMRALGSFRGMSVTIPHKVAVMEYLDEVDDLSKFVGCANTVTNDAGCLKGTTTDGPGALRAMADAGVSLGGKRVLFTGSGGAVRAVAFAAAMQAGPAAITILGRKPYVVDSLCQDIRDKTGANVHGGSLADDVRSQVPEHDVIIQGTPLGMYPNTMSETSVPAECLRPGQAVFDMVYRPYKTRFLKDAEAAGCTIVVGIDMLIHQAVIQFETWTGHSAPYAVMRNAVVPLLTANAT